MDVKLTKNSKKRKCRGKDRDEKDREEKEFKDKNARRKGRRQRGDGGGKREGTERTRRKMRRKL